MARKGGKRYRYRTNTQDIDWQEERADTSQNIGDLQRLFSAIAGVGFIIDGMRRRSLTGGVYDYAKETSQKRAQKSELFLSKQKRQKETENVPSSVEVSF